MEQVCKAFAQGKFNDIIPACASSCIPDAVACLRAFLSQLAKEIVWSVSTLSGSRAQNPWLCLQAVAETNLSVRCCCTSRTCSRSGRCCWCSDGRHACWTTQDCWPGCSAAHKSREPSAYVLSQQHQTGFKFWAQTLAQWGLPQTTPTPSELACASCVASMTLVLQTPSCIAHALAYALDFATCTASTALSTS